MNTCDSAADFLIYLYICIPFIGPILNRQLLLGTLTCMSKNLNLYNILHVGSVLQDGITMGHVYLNIPLLSERNRKTTQNVSSLQNCLWVSNAILYSGDGCMLK